MLFKSLSSFWIIWLWINLVYVVWKVLVNTHMCSLTDSRAVTSKRRGHDEQLRATSYAAQLELEEDVSL